MNGHISRDQSQDLRTSILYKKRVTDGCGVQQPVRAEKRDQFANHFGPFPIETSLRTPQTLISWLKFLHKEVYCREIDGTYLDVAHREHHYEQPEPSHKRRRQTRGGDYLKILRRTTGLRNTTTLKDPEDPIKNYQASHPLTKADDPTQTLSAKTEQSLREEIKEILPQFANHPFTRTAFYWYV